ncbi:hypothetical protein [Chroococcidiopsis cubana]|nr:hypothetical protein [Chroococcidiopsis cubana]
MTEMLIDYLRRIHANCEEAERLARAVSMRCWKRIGEQIVEMKKDGAIDIGGRPKPIDEHDRFNESTKVKLADLGITPDQSSNYQAMAAIPEPVFDEKREKMIRGEERVSKKSLVELLLRAGYS